jgi:hypothetical protein
MSSCPRTQTSRAGPSLLGLGQRRQAAGKAAWLVAKTPVMRSAEAAYASGTKVVNHCIKPETPRLHFQEIWHTKCQTVKPISPKNA